MSKSVSGRTSAITPNDSISRPAACITTTNNSLPSVAWRTRTLLKLEFLGTDTQGENCRGGGGRSTPSVLFLTPQFTFSTAPWGVGRNPPSTFCTCSTAPTTKCRKFKCRLTLRWGVYTARRYAKRGICRRRVSVCLSVTLRYCIKTAKRRITQTTPHDSLMTLVF